MMNAQSLCVLTLWGALPLGESAGDARSLTWPQFRGPQASGVACDQDLPEKWNTETWSNVRWKTPISGLGHASPIVGGGRIFIVTADSGETDPQLRIGLYGNIASVPEETAHTWQLLCLSEATGRILWIRNLHHGIPAIKRHTKASHANSTPATDGFHVVVSLGSEGLYCCDIQGNLIWKRDLGLLDSGYYRVPAAQWGFGSSPIIHKNLVIVQCDVQKDSFITALDVRDGRELWRRAREDVPTWGTPTIHEGKTRTEVVVNGYHHAGGYDPLTGEELWRLGNGGDIPVPTPITAHGLIFLSSAHGRQRPLVAVREGALGDITSDGATVDKRLAWGKQRAGIYMQTPIVYDEYLYACGDSGILSCYVAQTGEQVYRQRLGPGRAGFTASPVAADGKLYFTCEDGTVYVVQAGPIYKLLATNAMNEICMATPAISSDMLIVRTKNHVYAVGKPLECPTTTTDHSPVCSEPIHNVFAHHSPACCQPQLSSSRCFVLRGGRGNSDRTPANGRGQNKRAKRRARRCLIRLWTD